MSVNRSDPSFITGLLQFLVFFIIFLPIMALIFGRENLSLALILALLCGIFSKIFLDINMLRGEIIDLRKQVEEAVNTED